MESNFERIFEFAMKWEKWRSDNPNDPGGLTIWGISSKYYPKLVDALKDLSEEEAEEIAKKFYHDLWLRLSCDRTASPLDIVLFDSAIIPGPTWALNTLKICHDWRDFLFLRIRYFIDRPGTLFLEGWLNRSLDLWKTIREMK